MNLTLPSETLMFMGDIHGDFDAVRKALKHVQNTTLIVAGDCGFGFADTKVDKIKKMIKSTFEAFLEKRDNYVLFMRGNHDDPAYFRGDELTRSINTDRFRLVQDYTVVEVAGKKVLCVGGAVSIDRRMRKTDSSYWIKEEIIEREYMLYPNPEIDILCTHTISRKYVGWQIATKDWMRISFAQDKKLTPDCKREDYICDELQEDYEPKLWIHGHYHISYTQKTVDGTCDIVGLNINEVYTVK